MEEDPASLRESVARCRRLAKCVVDDQARAALERLADELELRAAAAEHAQDKDHETKT